MELRYLVKAVPHHVGANIGTYKNVLQYRVFGTEWGPWIDVPIVEE